MGRALGIDFGDRRIGMALSDPDQLIAFPHSVIEYSGRIGAAVDSVEKFIIEQVITCCVVGLPLNMDGSMSRQADRTRTFIGLLRKALPGTTTLETWDERLTSVQAGRAMQEAGLNTRQQRGRLDKVAAALILQSYLDAAPSSEHSPWCGREERP
jgi:putative holliday junction resolvase